MNNEEQARLQQEYPNWHIRQPPTMDCLIATRLRTLTQWEIYNGLYATLVEDTYERLSEALANQVKIEKDL